MVLVSLFSCRGSLKVWAAKLIGKSHPPVVLGVFFFFFF